MKIKSIYVNNFKSLVDFKIDLADFNCLVGLNGSGKSTFLQFVSFLSQLMKGDMKHWFDEHNWDMIQTPLDKIKTLKFRVEFISHDNLNGKIKEGYWEAIFHHLICFEECFHFDNYTLQVESDYKDRNRTFEDIDNDQRIFGYYTLTKNNEKVIDNERIRFKYQGSILSSLNEPEVNKIFDSVRKFVISIRSFDLLIPFMLRQPSISPVDSIGNSGEFFASYYDQIGEEERSHILAKLKNIFPQIDTIKVNSFDYSGKTKILSFVEKFSDKLEFVSYHANDGILRLIAFLSQLESDSSFLLFDEIENGINQEIIEFLLDQLISSDKQIVVTTHSPLFLNYLEDDLARKTVQYFYKTPEGFTRCIPFFSIPSVNEKLKMLGPGEIIADTNLTHFNMEIRQYQSTTPINS
ncbi:MAG: AAA family ATPase [Planctomycetaceae bacterium]|jgi:AAA15 family ATPase/GTPase|nr:AAA family ATPase [Planctomycetaceae bacterium]